MNIVTVVKYKLKDGFEDDFIKAINDYDYSNSLSMRLVSIGNNEYLSIMEYDEIDKTGDDEIDGVNWLDTVEQKTGHKITRIRPKETLPEMIKRQGVFPSPMMRFCTRMAKIKPMEIALAIMGLGFVAFIIRLIAWRKEEAQDRKKKIL
ncbi:MAG: hypothetical protein EBY45_12975 [Gammaproteobacteria bacterium]|nr:hypothetical protein [Gammaproteobacteria bacterium]